MSAKNVFISYSHDSEGHTARVLSLAWALRNHGINVELDQFHNEEIIDWPRWCNEQISREHSEFVICVCTAEYRRRLEGNEPVEKGKGVYWEGALLDDDIYDQKGNSRFISILLDEERESSIPRFLRGWTHCRLHDFTLSDAGYEHLVRILTRQAKVEKNLLGVIPVLPTKSSATASQASPQPEFRADMSRIIKYAPAQLIGREAETKILDEAWEKTVRGESERPHVLTFVALGGEGKTSLVAKWTAKLSHHDWPGCDAAFAWSFYSQGTREQMAASSDLFLREALTFFGDYKDKEFAAGNAGAYEKGQRLARIVGQRRSLLILDGLEPLQYAPTAPTPGELKDQGIAKLLKDLSSGNRGLCIVTTRYSLPDLRAFWQTTTPEVKLLRLSRDAGVHLLKTLGLKGSERRSLLLKDDDENTEKVNEFEKLVEDVKGHALTLTLLGSYLNDAHGGDIRKRNLVKLEEADDEVEVIPDHPHHAFHVMDAYVEWFETGGENEEENKKGLRALALLRLLGLFDRPATADCLNALGKGEAITALTEPLVGLTDAQRNMSLKRLDDAKLLTVNRDASGALVSLDAHPHLREYFARQLRTQQPDAWRAAHRRLYEHLCVSTLDKLQPTLEDLQPLYQAVAHGCQAGLQQEALDKVCQPRIWRRDEVYTARKLGIFASDLGAIACFFEKPWSHISPALRELSQAFLLSNAAYCLRALGRLTEALEPIGAGMDNYARQSEWKNAAVTASNLSELELTLGDVAGAVGDAEQSVTYADRSGDAFERMSDRTTHADALHQAGRRAEAETRFREAEQMHAERQPEYPLLYSVAGFRYCDVLLAVPERAVWQRTLQCGDLSPLSVSDLLPSQPEARPQSEKSGDRSPHSKTLHAVRKRATKALQIVLNGSRSLLDIGLNHLMLGRATLYAAVLENSDVRSDLSHIDAGVDGLRRAGTTHHLPRGLLTRAWLRFLGDARTGPESAQDDLNEAWEIAELGPMRLHMADIHLYRARLFHAVKPYPWNWNPDGSERGPKDDLREARKLIEKCGYWRRKEELEDAEEAAKNWD